MALVDLQQTVEDLDASLSSIENVLDPEAKKAEIADLEKQVAVPNLWDDQELSLIHISEPTRQADR